MALSLRKQYERVQKRLDVAISRVYACVDRSDIPFSGCLAQAPEDLRKELDAIQAEKARIRYAAIAAGKAWPGTFGMLNWNR